MAASAWARALAAAELLAADPGALRGAVLRARPGPVRDAWLVHLQALLPAGAPWRRLPLHAGADSLTGGIDLAATLVAGRAVAQRGLLHECAGGVLVVAMAERLPRATAALLAQALDGAVAFAVVALDEGDDRDETLPALLAERLAFRIDLSGIAWGDVQPQALPTRAAGRAAAAPAFDEAVVQALAAAAAALGVASPRAVWLAWCAARAAARTRGGDDVNADDAALAAQLVLSPRATQLPAVEPPPEAPPPPPPPPSDASDTRVDDDRDINADAPLQDHVLDAARTALPPGLLAALQAGAAPRARGAAGGQAAFARRGAARGGRPLPSRPGQPRGGARLALVETLRAAAPWQALRRGAGAPARIQVRGSDLHMQRREPRHPGVTVFVIDASGSQALHRLAEAKGAVQSLLSECYVRRDEVAVIAFRGRGAELLLPPTRSLARARRSLAGLPGGGGTPLAAGIDAAAALAARLARGGALPLVVLLTDGRANVARSGSGSGGRAQATDDALHAARRLRGAGVASLVIDSSPQPAPAAQALAAAMGAQYRALPHAGAAALSGAVAQAAGRSGRG